MTAKSADVLRQQPDGTWRFVIDNLGKQINQVVTELLTRPLDFQISVRSKVNCC